MSMMGGGFDVDPFIYNTAQRDANDAMRAASSAKTDVRFLEHEVNRLSLICEAMWTLLKQKLDVTDDQLVAMITQIDMSDGKLDGKKDTSGPRICDACAKPNSRRHVRCMYCGSLFRVGPFE